MPRRLPLLAPLVPLVLGVACAAPGAHAPAGPPPPSVELEVEEGGPWKEVPPDASLLARADPGTPTPAPGPAAPATLRAPSPSLDGAPPDPWATTPPSPSSRPRLPVPERRVTGEPAALGDGPVAPVDPHERFLANPTRVRAGTATFYCPRRYAAEARLTGTTVEKERAGREVATGGARLVCRELTIEADRLILQVRKPGEEDVQITARGSASLVSERRGHVTREEGARALIVTNDHILPLR